eukprot:scaffold8212_cov93-Cylindrotheca_fusiformis.AAC.5
MMLLSILLFVGPPTISLVYGLCVWITYALSYEFPWVSEEVGKLLIPSSLVLTVAIANTCMGMKLLIEAKTTTTVNDDDNDDYSLIIYNIKNLLNMIAYWAGSAECIYRIRKQVVVGIDSIPFYGKDHLKGKTILITGANAGIGKETAFQLASMGAKRIVLLCRSQSRAEAAIAELVARGTNASSSSSVFSSIKKEQFSICPCDLSDFQSIRNAVDFMTTQLKIDNVHVLINNAGLILGTQTKSKKDGYEMMMQANHLGHFLLTNLLLDRNILLKEGSRIVNLTSALFQFAINNKENGGFDFEDMFCENGHRKYTMFGPFLHFFGFCICFDTCSLKALLMLTIIVVTSMYLGQYSQTKLANILFTKELVRRYPKIVSYAVHPGIVETNIASNMNWYLRIPAKMFAWFVYSLRKTSVQGAYGSVYCAAAPLEELPPSNNNGDGYYYWIQNCTLRHVQMTTTAADDAKRLWTISEQLTGHINK